MANSKATQGKASNKTMPKRGTNQKIQKNTRSNTQSRDKNNSGRSLDEVRHRNQVKAVLLFASAILLGALVLIPGENLWLWLHNFLMGLFSGWAILWPLLMIYVAVVTALEEPRGRVSNKIWLTALVIVLVCATVYIFSDIQIPKDLNPFQFIGFLYESGINGKGSGLIGGLIGTPLLSGIGSVGAKIFIVLLLFVGLMILTRTTLIGLFKTIKRPVSAVSGGIQNVRQRREEERKLLEQNRIDIDLGTALPMHPVLAPSPMSEDSGDKKKKKNKGKNPKLEELNRAFGIASGEFSPDSDPVVTTEQEIPIPQINFGSPEELMKKEGSAPILAPQPIDAVKIEDIQAEIHSSPLPAPIAPAAPASVTATPVESTGEILENAAKAAAEFMKKKEEAEKLELASTAQMALYEEGKDKPHSYCFPPVSLLKAGKKLNVELETEELQTNGKKLVETLKSFGVQTKIIDICRGPSVTRYELQPAAGVKISKITNLADDLALNLAATGVRIEAPIPGKPAVGIEIPNKNKTTVCMRELVESNAFATAKSKLTVALGRDIAGQVTVANLAKMPHMLIAGTTGSGKSVCINSLIISLLYKSSPDEVRFLMVDPKVVELGVYNGIPHLLVPVVTDPRKAAGALNWAVTEMLNRYKIFAEFNVKDLQGYNHLAEVNGFVDENGQPMLKMPQIVIIIDELADLMMAAPNEVEDSICRLAQMARAAGMHLVVATQRPTVDVVTGLIKANIPSRIAFAVSSAIDSRTILDSQGAEKLLGQGDMLFSPVGVHKPTRIQGCFVSEAEIEAIVDFVKKSREIEYDEKIMEDIERNALAEAGKRDKSDEDSGDGDPVMNEAIKCVIEAGQASTSLLQRRLRLGYARAGRLIDEMEQMGIVGPHEGSKPRQVLMSYQQWMERNMQKSDSNVEDES